MLEKLDPYTVFYPESEKEEYEFQTTGKFGGIGTRIEIFDSLVFVGDIFENSPIDKAGIKPGHQIISIDDVPVTGKDEEEISLLLRGAAGTPVTMEFKHPKTGVIEKKVITRDRKSVV